MDRGFGASFVSSDHAEISDDELEAMVNEYELHTTGQRIPLGAIETPVTSSAHECSVSGHYLGSEVFFEALGRSHQFAASSKRFQKNSVIVTLRDAGSPTPHARHGLTVGLPSYVVAYRFGCVVFFNVATEDKDALLDLCSRFTAEPAMDEQAREGTDTRPISELSSESIHS